MTLSAKQKKEGVKIIALGFGLASAIAVLWVATAFVAIHFITKFW